MSRYIAAYDVGDDLQRGRIARALSGFGYRIQYSVYEVWIEANELPEFRLRIGALLGADDAFDLVPIDTDPRRHRLRWQHELDGRAVVVVE